MSDEKKFAGDKDFSPFDIWTKGGVTEHLGGVNSTRALLEGIKTSSNPRILEIGCGTGYSINELNKINPAHYSGIDLLLSNLTTAKKKSDRTQSGRPVWLFQADAHNLPFRNESFDLVLVESVLVFCQLPIVLKEIIRVLVCGGKIAVNEFTFLKPPPPQLADLVQSKMGLTPYDQKSWEDNFTQNGFVEVSSKVNKINFLTQASSHIKVDGLKNYFRAVIAGVKDPVIRHTFFTKEMLKAARLFLPYIGYGLYTGTKP